MFAVRYPVRRKKNITEIVNRAISLIDIDLQIIRRELQRGEISLNRTITNSSIKWSGTAADLVEFAYGALELKKFNNGDIDINNLIKQLSICFSFEIKDCYDTFRAIRRRVGSRTLFLNEMTERLNERMNDMDNGIFKKKKIRK